ncbi:MAG: Asp-tRNA(Asn)/Glu-tRNA(Gln) amidotransferase GatCAB subunit C [Candidatus Methanoplasma sp.]|jgi:aspartyl-tRNA(Asn)/glutamyl-tRNA(Gln) amidotransferase subunit C|nr:Asp-tRNA(Asn)/Glu-tRNA(Gln) amidotransferase GatCAB subunit C [Candidatus Methanoplasma sp.]
MDKEAVSRVARAAHIALTEEELDRYSKDLGDILDYFKVLDEAPEGEGNGVDPIEIADITREDEPHIDIDPFVLLENMKTYDGFVRGPRLS